VIAAPDHVRLNPAWTAGFGGALVQVCTCGCEHRALGTVASTAFVAPFTSAVTSVQYLDQRMRKEAYDVELMQQAGITAS